LNDLAEVVVTPEGIAVDAADTRIGFDRGASRTTVTRPGHDDRGGGDHGAMDPAPFAHALPEATKAPRRRPGPTPEIRG
jgi:hypothetical protein